MQYLFDCWGRIRNKMLKAGHLLLCLDFDGTLCPIKPRPEDALLDNNICLLLQRISRNKRFSIGIISGRSLKDIQQKVDAGGLFFAGNHGLEIIYKKKKFIFPAAKKFIPLIREISQKLAKELIPFPQAVLEAKDLSLSLHYRLITGTQLPALKARFLQVIKPYLEAGKIKLTFGKKVWEVRPPIEWDKGKALLWLIKSVKAKSVLAVYIGDDQTDEDAFRAANKIAGLSIRVGRKRTSRAGYYLKNVRDVARFLSEIEKSSKCRI